MKEYTIKAYKSLCRLVISDTLTREVKVFKNIGDVLKYIEKKENAGANTYYCKRDYTKEQLNDMFTSQEPYEV
jgi:hypothetical protein